MHLASKKVSPTKSQKAGLVFNVDCFDQYLHNLVNAEVQGQNWHVGGSVPVYQASVFEYLTAEMLELSGNCAKDNGRNQYI